MKYSEAKIRALLYKYLTGERSLKLEGHDSPYALEIYQNYIATAGFAVLENSTSGGPGFRGDMLLVVWDRPQCHDVFIIHPGRLELVTRKDF